MKIIELIDAQNNENVNITELLDKEMITFDECQLMKKESYNFLWERFVNENVSTYKVFYRNDYIKDINIDFTNAE